jgi:type II secretory pathway component PulF
MSVQDKARLYRELAKLIGASFPLEKSVAMLAEQNAGTGRAAFLNGIRNGLNQRLPFADALEQGGGSQVSEMEIGLVRAGERSGHLAESCDHLAHYFELWHKGIREARGAMVYPLVLLHVGIVLPEISRSMLLGSISGNEVQHPVQSMITRIALFWLLLLGIWWLWRTLSKLATKSADVDRALNLLPLVGAVRRHWALARFCEVFHSALLAAMSITECLKMAGDASQSGILRTGADIAVPKINQGAALEEALVLTNAFPRTFTNSIATAEAAGGLDHEFKRWAQAETDMAGEAQRRVSDWYPKAMYFLVLGYVAMRIIGFASDYYGMITNIDKLMQ